VVVFGDDAYKKIMKVKLAHEAGGLSDKINIFIRKDNREFSPNPSLHTHRHTHTHTEEKPREDMSKKDDYALGR
jgi:hypothetical protein